MLDLLCTSFLGVYPAVFMFFNLSGLVEVIVSSSRMTGCCCCCWVTLYLSFREDEDELMLERVDLELEADMSDGIDGMDDMEEDGVTGGESIELSLVLEDACVVET